MLAEIYNPTNIVINTDGEESLFQTIPIESVEKDEFALGLVCKLLLEQEDHCTYTKVLDILLGDIISKTKSQMGMILTSKPMKRELRSNSTSTLDDSFVCMACSYSDEYKHYWESSPTKDSTSKDVLYTLEDYDRRKLLARVKCGVVKSGSSGLMSGFIGNGIFGYILRKNVIVISNNPSKDPRFQVKKFSNNHPNITKFLGIPLIIQGTCCGILALSTDHDYTVDHVQMLHIKLIEMAAGCVLYKPSNVDSVVINTLKNNYFATLSHEIRTPLNGIIGMVTMLGDAGPLNAKQTMYIKNLTDCVFQLSNLMNNILDFSKMMSQKFHLLKQPFSLSNVVDDAFKMIEGSALTKGIEMRKNISIVIGNKEVHATPNDLPTLVGDGQRLTQILTNLLGNAVKFTEKGFISLRVKISHVKNGPICFDNLALKMHESDMMPDDKTYKQINVKIEISDTGIGIPKEEQNKIFEVFHQAQQPLQSTNAGTGLGLAIVKELVRLMGGRIGVHSEGVPGKGSTFTFNAVFDEEINIHGFSSKTAKMFKGAKILAVDDRQDIRLQLCELLLRWGCDPITVASAEEGLRYINHGTKFDTIIVDICMPYMSGVEMAQELRKRIPDTPLIGLSSADTNTGEKYFDVYLFKPISQNTLFPALHQCLSKNANTLHVISKKSVRKSPRDKCPENKGDTVKRRRKPFASSDEPLLREGDSKSSIPPSSKSDSAVNQEASTVTTRTGLSSTSSMLSIKSGSLTKSTSKKDKRPTKEKLNILVAEDENANSFTITEMLYNIGFRNYTRVENGKLCVEAAQTICYDVILMDIKMPIMDGIEATKIIRSTPSCGKPYIIAVSAAILNSDKQKYEASEIDAFLPKPITKDSLSAILAPLIKKT